jgi:hypothetical protein
VECAHCHADLEGRRRGFCNGRCRQAAYRRRRAGLPEDYIAGSGRRGRVPLAGKTRVELAAALDEIRSTVDGVTAVLEARDLLEANLHLVEAIERLDELTRVADENRAERDARMQT